MGCSPERDEKIAVVIEKTTSYPSNQSDRYQVERDARLLAEYLTEAGYPSVAGFDPRESHVRVSQIRDDKVAKALEASGPILRSPTVQHLLSDLTTQVRQQSLSHDTDLLSSAQALTELLLSLDLVVHDVRDSVRPGDLSSSLPDWWSLSQPEENGVFDPVAVVIAPANTPASVIDSYSSPFAIEVAGAREVKRELMAHIVRFSFILAICVPLILILIFTTGFRSLSQRVRTPDEAQETVPAIRFTMLTSIVLGLATMILPSDLRLLSPFSELDSIQNIRYVERLTGSMDVFLAECEENPNAAIAKRHPTFPDLSKPDGGLAMISSRWTNGLAAPLTAETIASFVEEARALDAPRIALSDQLEPFSRLLERRLESSITNSRSRRSMRSLTALHEASVVLSRSLQEAGDRGEHRVGLAYTELREQLISELVDWDQQPWPEPTDLPDAAWQGEAADKYVSFSLDAQPGATGSRNTRLSWTRVKSKQRDIQSRGWQIVDSGLSKRLERFERHFAFLILGVLAGLIAGWWTSRGALLDNRPTYLISALCATCLAAALVGFGHGSWNIWSITTMAIAPWWFTLFVTFRPLRRLSVLVAMAGFPAIASGPFMPPIFALTLPLALIGWWLQDYRSEEALDLEKT